MYYLCIGKQLKKPTNYFQYSRFVAGDAFPNFLIQKNMKAILNEDTPIALLTVGQLRELMSFDRQPETVAISNEKRLVYGLRGIRTLFNVSHATAYRYKETILKDAVSQQGRKIVVDVDKALQLFNNHGGK